MGKEFKPDAPIINQVIKTEAKPPFSLSFRIGGEYPREMLDNALSYTLVGCGHNGNSADIEDVSGEYKIEFWSHIEMDLKEMKSKFLARLDEKSHSMAGI